MFGVIDGFYIGNLSIKFYGIFMALAMAIGVFVACKNARFRGLKSDDILILALYALPLAIIGARIYYVIFNPEPFKSFVDVLKVWDGGLAVYGGIIGGAIALTLYCLIHKKNFFDVADVAVPALVLGQAIGRIGCFFGGCCYGIEVTNPALCWYPLATEIAGKWHYATFFYESFACFIIFIILMLMLRKWKIRDRGVLMFSYLGMYGITRCIIETFRGDSLYLGPIKVSQLLSGILILLSLIYLITFYILKKKNKLSPMLSKVPEILPPVQKHKGKIEKKDKDV